MSLNEMSWTEAKKYFAKNDIAIVPVGSNEQHGPHSPLGTDHLIAQALAQKAAEKTGVLCLPVVPFGVSSHHRQFWGTIFISPDTFKSYVKEACLSLRYCGVKKIVIVNGHGGNLDALKQAARGLRETGMFVSVFQWWTAAAELLPDLFKSDERSHACAEETAMNLLLYPNTVRMRDAADEVLKEYAFENAGISLPLDIVDYSASGVLGKSSTASARKGKKVFDAVVGELVRHINALKKAKVKDLVQKPLI
jgi:creatinine amidohydrolase